MARIRIGISGWTYPPWRGIFYPADLPQKRELEFASRAVSSIEINGTFYSLQTPASFAAWSDAAPPDFLFAVKGNRFITHIRRLRDVAVPLANFFASGVLKLGAKLGPLLWQLPPNLVYDRATIDSFLQLLPRNTKEAAVLARDQYEPQRHKRGTWLKADRTRRMRHAIEVRHASFENEEFVQLLRRHGVALVIADTAGKWPLMEDVTADFLYLRLHGDEELYASGYTPKALKIWARKIKDWKSGGAHPKGAKMIAKPAQRRARGRDVFVYFDNDVKVRAPYDAMLLAHLVGAGPAPPKLPCFNPPRRNGTSGWAGLHVGKNGTRKNVTAKAKATKSKPRRPK
ncbi:MAG TPA: DUF72 domain-containing protein [Verrucomicrobiaceae bacterium]|jgi:uncharacterized protein YecE (DUF72 family)